MSKKGKGKFNPQVPTSNKPAKAQSAAPVTTPSEPTPGQIKRLEEATAQKDAIIAECGPPVTEGVLPQVGPTLEESLRLVERLLRETKDLHLQAQKRETASKEEQTSLANQKRDQESDIQKKKKGAEADIAAAKKLAEDERTEKKQELDLLELDLCERIDAVEKREKDYQAKEAKFIEQNAQLTKRELEAEQCFLNLRARIFKSVEEDARQLREERDRLDAEITARREKFDTEIVDRREKIEEEFRAKARTRAEKWAEEDTKRTEAEADARRRVDDSVAKERQDQLSKLRTQLTQERAATETALNAEHQRLVEFEKQLRERNQHLNERLAALDAELAQRKQDAQDALDAELDKVREAHDAQLAQRAQELENRASNLSRQERDLRSRQATLAVDRELLEDDRLTFENRLDRLVAERTEDLRHNIDTLTRQLNDARTTRDRYFADVESRRELDRRFGGRSPEDILSALNDAERERDMLMQQLRERPDIQAAERLAELERERSTWLENRAVLQGDLAKARGELAERRLAAIELETLRQQKEALEVHKQLLNGAVDELRARVDELTRQDDRRNPMTALTSLDDNDEFQTEVRTTTPFGRATQPLKEFAADLRHRIARGVEGRTLYYADRDVRAFLGGLAMSRLMLLQGISGTGKTSLPLAFAKAVGGGIEIVEVQAGWRDRQDLVGYYNAFHRHYYATNFLQALYKAQTPAYRDRLFLMVLDEINLSRPEQFFADFLSALERPLGERRLTLVNDPVTNAPRLMVEGRHLPIPPNVWFIGTANHDESTAEFADKTYDRAHVMEMPRKTEAAHFDVEDKKSRNPLSYKGLDEAFNMAANNHAATVKNAIDWLRSAPFACDLQRQFRVGWGNRLENQIARYLPVIVESGGSIGEAMDHLLVTKVLRKLKDRHDVRVKSLEDLHDNLLKVWEKLDDENLPERCVTLIEAEISAKNGEELE